MRVIAYLRVSTERQAEEGSGLDVQRQAIRAWAKSAGHRIVRWAADEGVSGSEDLAKRIGLLDAMNAVQGGEVGGLVVYRLDRLARDLVIQESLLSNVWGAGGRIFSTSAAEDDYLDPQSAKTDPSRALIRQVLGAVAQYERAMVRLRMDAGKAHKAAQGGYIGGGIPYGCRVERGELVNDESEHEVLDLILEMHADGRSLRAICDHLNDNKVKPRRGSRWHPEGVARIVRRAASTALAS